MKVLIIVFNNLSKCPYVNPYADFCRNHGIRYELLVLNRSGVYEPTDVQKHEIAWNSGANKMSNFMKFRKEAIRHLKQNQYDFIIVLTTIPAVLLSGYLSRCYKGRYLVDIRDYSYENVCFFYTLERQAIRHAAVNVISSPGFRKFLPEANYALCHNVNAAYRYGECRRFDPTQKPHIIIGYVGSITYKDQCMHLIHLVEQDPRFCFHFYGNEVGDDRITRYVAEHPNERIRTFGPYKPSEKENIMSKVDILFNAYGSGRPLVTYALSNKLYDAYHMGLPLLTSPDTSMSEEAGDYSFDLDIGDPRALDGLYGWYRQIDGQAFYEDARDYLQQVFRDQDEFERRLQQVLLR